MSQRKSVNGRPSGTDGSDFSYRMVVDSRYQKGFIQFLAAVVIFLPTLEGSTLDRLSVSSSVEKRSRVNFLKLYLFGSSVAALISIVCLLKSEKTTEIIKDLSRWETSKFEFFKIAAVLLGTLVQIFAVSVTTSLIHNMAPPKRAS
ncbi:hypothetical protein DH2020_022184 [Rehmannia glutinosa]|uniref:CASP-like protein n=1 Tax=Rehmannia glutinosa TaxID=99300 RepID=A0ABR0WGA7_REHGL